MIDPHATNRTSSSTVEPYEQNTRCQDMYAVDIPSDTTMGGWRRRVDRRRRDLLCAEGRHGARSNLGTTRGTRCLPSDLERNPWEPFTKSLVAVSATDPTDAVELRDQSPETLLQTRWREAEHSRASRNRYLGQHSFSRVAGPTPLVSCRRHL